MRTDPINTLYIKPEGIREILRYKSYFANRDNTFFKPSKSGPNPYEYASTIKDFIMDLYRTDFIQPFNWVSWKESAEAQKMLNNPVAIRSANMADLVKLLTYHLRADNFMRGHLASVIEEGQILLILERIEELSESNHH